MSMSLFLYFYREKIIQTGGSENLDARSSLSLQYLPLSFLLRWGNGSKVHILMAL